jgi:hypothetical protein
MYFIFLQFFGCNGHCLGGGDRTKNGGNACVLKCEDKLPVYNEKCTELDQLNNLAIELVFECMLLILLSVCAFQSFLAIEKVAITIILCVATQCVVWIFPFPALNNRQFHLWMQENPGYANQTFEVQTKNYCR